MSGLHCPKKLWQTVYDPEPLQDSLPGTVKGMGIEVGVKARLLWPGGVFIDTLDSAEAIRRTKALLTDLTVPAIFEAALTYDGVLVRVDVLERLPDGCWRLNEVKSSTRIRNEHLEDVALQTYVVAGTGLELAEAYLVYVNDNYVQGEGIDWNAQTASGSRIRCGYCARRRRSPGSDTARTTAVSADHRHSHAGH